MKKIILLFSAVALGAVLFSSCDINSFPEFDNKDAFLAFNSVNLSFDEDSGIVSIPVSLSSLGNLTSSASYEIVSGTAVQGVNFRPVASTQVLNFTAEAPVQNIQIEIVNLAGDFTGDLDFTVKLTDAGSVDLGANNECAVKILDLDHPLVQFFGTWNGQAPDAWGGDNEWTTTIAKDETNLNMLWFSNLPCVNGVGPVYGIINEEKTEIRIPVGQIFLENTSGKYMLWGWYWDEEEEWNIDIPEGGNIIFTVNEDATELFCKDMYGCQAPSQGWNNVIYYVTFTKQ